MGGTTVANTMVVKRGNDRANEYFTYDIDD